MSAALEAERPFLWSLCYRLLGDAADADEVVQEAFLRALERPPADTGLPWRPWLVRVAANLARDRLRARRRRHYVGPWLPSPVPDALIDALPTPEGRYGRAESASFAFLLALEALTPTQRLVVVLRDVFELDAAATARTLGTTPGAVRAAHHKARVALALAEPLPPPADRVGAMALLSAFLAAVSAGDPVAAGRLLTDDATTFNDAGGRHHAARLPVTGATKVARFHVHLARDIPPGLRWRFDWYNGLPALVATVPDPPPGAAPGWVLLAAPAADGRIARLYSVLVAEKLVRVEPVA